MLYYLIYISKAAKLMDDQDLALILERSNSWNSTAHITGMLLYLKGSTTNNVNGNFIQVLEGEEEDVKYLFNNIKNDVRHHSILLLNESHIEKRSFQNWLMGFKAVNSSEFSNISGYINIEEFYNYQSKPKDFNVALNYLKTFYSMYS